MSFSILHLRRPLADGPATYPERSVPSVTRPRWRRAPHPHHLALAALLALTALAFLWDLTASGDANSFYAAAVQAGTRSWKAFLFGSLDASNFITVDKPPASLWVMELSGRIFGFSSASMLVPEALEGVIAVALLYASVRRWFGDWAGIAAGALLALTPVAALMFRFNNPDALLVALLVGSAYCLTRALERGATRWIVAAGALVGWAFLAKMLQAFVVLPGFALVWMVCAPVSLRRRLAGLLASGLAVLVSCGWWVAMVALWPVADRPMIDGSPTNSILNLIFGYNGLGRVFGGSGDGGGGGGGMSFSGAAGPLRLFNDLMGAQASWLLPAALVALVGGLVGCRRAVRTDRRRAALLLWGGWLVVTGLVFSFSSGIIHTYYTVALAPAIAALVAIAGRLAWEARHDRRVQALVATVVLATAGWADVLLARAAWNPWLQPLVIACAVVGVGLLAVVALPGVAPLSARLSRRLAAGGAALACVACLAGPLAYTLDTVTTPHTGSVPTAGPATASGGLGGRPGGFGVGRGGLGGSRGALGSGASAPRGAAPQEGSPGRGGFGAPPGGATTSERGSGGGSAFAGGRAGGGGAATVTAALRRALRADSSRYRWVAATSGSQTAASYELATGGTPVMAIGGFSGEGGNLTLSQFEHDVARGEIHYYIASGGQGGPAGGRGQSSSILSWVQSHFTKQTIGGTTVYNLTAPRSSR